MYMCMYVEQSSLKFRSCLSLAQFNIIDGGLKFSEQ